jgi:zinc protease
MEASRGQAPWVVRAGVSPANVDRALESILVELRRLRTEAVSEEELADVKAYFTGTMPIRLETADGRARMLHSIEYFQLGPDYLARYPDLVQRVTREQVLRAAQEHINIDTYSLVIAGPVNE